MRAKVSVLLSYTSIVVTKAYPRFFPASLVLKQLILYIFHKKEMFWIKLNLLKIKNYNLKKSGHSFRQHCFVKLCRKFQSKRASCSGTGVRGTWQPMIFTYFTSSSSSKFSWHSSFNLARSTYSYYWCYIFTFVIIFTKNINTEGNTRYSLAIGEQTRGKLGRSSRS